MRWFTPGAIDRPVHNEHCVGEADGDVFNWCCANEMVRWHGGQVERPAGDAGRAEAGD